MKNLVCSLLFSASFLLAPRGFARNSDGSSYGPGILISPSYNSQASSQDSVLDKDLSDSSSDQNATENTGNDRGTPNSTTDQMVIKSTNAVMSQIKANMKLTQDQITAAQPVIEDNIAKVRGLQLSLEMGTIDSKTMYRQRKQLNSDEDQKLKEIFTSDQMKVWMNMQNS